MYLGYHSSINRGYDSSIVMPSVALVKGSTEFLVSGTWLVPDNVTFITLYQVGGGDFGANGDFAGGTGGVGGGGGGYGKWVDVPVIPGTSFDITLATGGGDATVFADTGSGGGLGYDFVATSGLADVPGTAVTNSGPDPTQVIDGVAGHAFSGANGGNGGNSGWATSGLATVPFPGTGGPGNATAGLGGDGGPGNAPGGGGGGSAGGGFTAGGSGSVGYARISWRVALSSVSVTPPSSSIILGTATADFVLSWTGGTPRFVDIIVDGNSLGLTGSPVASGDTITVDTSALTVGNHTIKFCLDSATGRFATATVTVV